MKNLKVFSTLIVCFLLIVSCDPINPPVVTHNPPTVSGFQTLIYSGASGNVLCYDACVTSIGDAPLTDYGVCWVGTDGGILTPTINDNKLLHTEGENTSFTCRFTYGTLALIHVRSYATNKYGTSYGPLQNKNKTY